MVQGGWVEDPLPVSFFLFSYNFSSDNSINNRAAPFIQAYHLTPSQSRSIPPPLSFFSTRQSFLKCFRPLLAVIYKPLQTSPLQDHSSPLFANMQRSRFPYTTESKLGCKWIEYAEHFTSPNLSVIVTSTLLLILRKRFSCPLLLGTRVGRPFEII